MKMKKNQKATRALRQARNYADVVVAVRNFPGRVIWSGTVRDMHASEIVCGIPQPLLMSPSTKDAAEFCERFIAKINRTA